MSVVNYAPGDPILIRNIITQLKSQGVFDQFRKECISDVDTKPAYQNLCHRVDGQVSSYLSEIRWGPDLNKNQLRESIRKFVNECSFVESGINRIVDQLVNPRINTILVPKVEDIVYKYIGIRRPEEYSINEIKESKSTATNKVSADGVSNQNEWSNSKSDGSSVTDKNRSFEPKGTVENEVDEHNVFDAVVKKEEEDQRSPENFVDENHVEENSLDFKTQDDDNDEKHDDTRTYSNIESDEELDDDDDLSPPFEAHTKSDVDTPAVSVESDHSAEVLHVKEEPQPKQEPSETIVNDGTERPDEASVDSSASFACAEVEKSGEATPALDIPKTPTINYETSEDSDDAKGAMSADTDACENRAELTTSCDDVPNFDRIAQKIAADNRDEAKRETDAVAVAIAKPDEEAANAGAEKTERSPSSDKRRKDSDKSGPNRPNDLSRDSRDKKHTERRKEKDRHRSERRESSRSDKDRRGDREHERHRSSKDRDRSRKAEADHEKGKENGSKSGKHHEERRSKDEKRRESLSRSDKHSRRESKDDKRRSSGGVKHHENDKESKSKKGEGGVETKKQPKDQCAGEKLKSDRRSSDRDSSGPSASTSNAGHSSHRSSSKSEREKHEKHSDRSKHSSSSHKSKKSSSSSHHRRESKSDKSASSDSRKSSGVKNGLSSSRERSKEHCHVEKMLECIHGAGEPLKSHKTTNSLKRRFEETAHEELVDVLNGSIKFGDNIEIRKPKIARNETEFCKAVRLRKEFKEKMKLLQQQGKENAATVDNSHGNLLPKEAKNYVNIENTLASPFKEFFVNLSRIDECLPIVNGRYLTCDKAINDRNNNDDGASARSDNEKQNSDDDEDGELDAAGLRSEEIRKRDIEEIIGCRTKNTHITYRVDMDITNVNRLDEKNESGDEDRIQRFNCMKTDDDFRYFEVCDTGYREEFRKFVEETTQATGSNDSLRNFSIELRYPKRFDDIFRTQLGATVQRYDVETDSCERLTSAPPLKYNSEIINQKGEEKGIMMRIKMCSKSKSEDLNDTTSKKRKKVHHDDEIQSQESPTITDEKGSSSSSSCVTNSSHMPPVATVKRKTLGIKRKISNGKMKVALNGHISNSEEAAKTDSVSVEDEKNEVNKLDDSPDDRCIDKTVPQTNNSDFLEGKNSQQPIAEAEMEIKNVIPNHNLEVTNSSVPSTKTPKNQRRNSSVKNTGDQTSKDAVPKRTPSQTKCYYDSSDLYKPRPSFLQTTRRCRGLNSENK